MKIIDSPAAVSFILRWLNRNATVSGHLTWEGRANEASQKTCQITIVRSRGKGNKSMIKKLLYISVLLLLLPLHIQGQDTSRRVKNLSEVSVVGLNSRPDDKQTQTPTQVVATEELKKLGGLQLSDAINQMSGASMKDYGGIGGIKTVSARGLGSQFSTLAIDGIAVNDCQNGQVDLGRYLLGNSSYISMSNGQEDHRLQSARSYAAGSIINMTTRIPEFGERDFNLHAGLEGGSFGYLSPTASWEQRINQRLLCSFWGNFIKSDGNYPFTHYYTLNHNDSSSREIRTNSQMQMSTLDANLFYLFDAHQQLHLKAHYLKSYHALPGHITNYSTRGSEHLWSDCLFTQLRYWRTHRKLDIQLLAKYQRSNDLYLDTAILTSVGNFYQNDYHQQEAYLSQAFCYTLGKSEHKPLHFSLSADESLSQLHSNLENHNDVLRLSLQGVLAAEYQGNPNSVWLSNLKVNLHLLGTYIQDQEPALDPSQYKKVSPYAGISKTIKHITLRYFYKETFRVPTFNELFFKTIGPTLRPERARQHNLGISYHSPDISFGNHTHAFIHSTMDIYYNRVSDKIVAMPTQNMYLWSMFNLGEALIAGADITASTRLYFEHAQLDLSAGYTYQYAVDRSDPNSKIYNHQIVYTPRHSGNASALFHSRWIDLGYTLQVVGSRYFMKQNSHKSRLPAYSDHGITLSHDFKLITSRAAFKGSTLQLKAQVLNLFDIQYEVVRSYPMMGRNYRLGIVWNL